MKVVLLFFLVCIGASSAVAFDHSHQKWTKTLKSYQSPEGLVFYKKLKSEMSSKKPHLFLEYLNEIQKVTLKDYETFTKEQKMAFLINSYNALTVKLIIDNYPVKSIKKIGGWFTKPWSIEFFSLLSSKIKSLDPIEHDWLRPKFKDYRIHAAVNCASISCPPLRGEAFVAEKLDSQLDDQMKLWLKDKKRNQVSAAKKTWQVSKIFSWYKSDFDKWGGGVPKVIGRYLEPPVSEAITSTIEIDYLSYDWNLNEAK